MEDRYSGACCIITWAPGTLAKGTVGTLVPIHQRYPVTTFVKDYGSTFVLHRVEFQVPREELITSCHHLPSQRSKAMMSGARLPWDLQNTPVKLQFRARELEAPYSPFYQPQCTLTRGYLLSLPCSPQILHRYWCVPQTAGVF